MAGSANQGPAAAGRGHLRTSHADREQVIGTLKVAFAQGRLAKDEFDLRVGQALGSRTYAELAVLTSDLPAGLFAAQPPEPAPAARPPGLRPAAVVMMAETALYAGMWPLAFALPRSSDGYPLDGMNLIGSGTLFYLLILIVTYVCAQASRRGVSSDPADSDGSLSVPDACGQLP